MFKNTFLLILIFFLLISCRFFTKQSATFSKTSDTIINLESVDAYPLFIGCDSIPSRAKQRVCFQIKIAAFIHNELQNHDFVIPENVHDTAFVKIKISEKGNASIQSIQLKQHTKQLLPTFDSILSLSISKIPRLKPAIKRSFPVTTIFTLPIEIRN